MERHRLSVEPDLAFVERVNAADAFHQRRLAGAVVAEEGEDLAAPGLEAHVLQRMHRPEALLRVTDGEHGCGLRGHCARAAWRLRARPSR